MKISIWYRYLQWFFQKTPKPHRMISVLRPVLPSPIYGMCNGYWMRLDLVDVIQRLMYLDKYEPAQSQWVKEILKPGARFVDVGANVGHYTMLAASLVGTGGRVVAFEPSPYAYKKLSAVLAENRISQVEVYQCAAGDEDGQLSLYLPSEDYLHSPSLVRSDSSYIPLKVDVCRLDTHASMAKPADIDMMKIDVEGFEPNALRGMRSYLQSGHVKYLLCEFNSGWLEPNGSSCEALLQLIIGMGFNIYKETPQATVTAPNGLVYKYQDILFKFRDGTTTAQT